MGERNSGLAYFIVGMGVGVAIGILLAPRSGRETRDYLRQKAGEGRDYLKERTDEGKEYLRRRSSELREQAGDLVDRGKEAISHQKDQLAAAFEAGRQAYRETVGGTGEGV